MNRLDLSALPDSGAYQLLIHVARDVCVRVGRLGWIDAPAGWYVYTGSAKRALPHRVARHLRRRKRRHWHVDYLLGRRDVRVTAVRAVAGPEADECALNQATGAQPGCRPVWPGFGSSDCRAGCVSHVANVPAPEAWEAERCEKVIWTAKEHAHRGQAATRRRRHCLV